MIPPPFSYFVLPVGDQIARYRNKTAFRKEVAPGAFFRLAEGERYG
jgi:hypothetical protein